jgi:hypothetical protein
LTRKVKEDSNEIIAEKMKENIQKIKSLDIKQMVDIAMERFNKVEIDLDGCRWTNWLNDYDKPFNLDLENKVLVGVESKHSNRAEDRRFKFKYCKIRAKIN